MRLILTFLLTLILTSGLYAQKITRNEFVEGSQKIVEVYENDLLKEVETYTANKLESTDVYYYSDSGELEYLERYNSADELLYKETYFRNRDGSLRRLVRDEFSGLYHHWFYKDDKISESWLIEGERRTRSIYTDGRVDRRVVYEGDEIISDETFNYSPKGTLSTSSEIFDDQQIQKNYDREGLLKLVRVYSDDILVKQTEYQYSDGEVILEKISGHGQRERVEYIRDEEGELTSSSYFINDTLKKRHYFHGEEGETIEYFRDGTIYQKEYYKDGERVQKDLYLNGELFSSEKLDE